VTEQHLDPVPAGQVLDALGVELALAQGQQVTECVVIAKVADFSDEHAGTALAVAYSKGLDWIDQRGLISAGLYMIDQSGTCQLDDED
jgi:hypothetical protein